MRPAAALVASGILLLLLAPSWPAGAVAPITNLGVRLEAPEGIGTHRDYVVTGRVNTVASLGVPQATVEILVAGVPVAASTTGADGTYAIALVAPPIAQDLVLVARASVGGTLVGESKPVTVAVRRPPDAPGSPTISQVGLSTTARLTWTEPATHGAPIQNYSIRRAGAQGWDVIAVLPNGTLQYDDPAPTHNRSYTYTITVTTFAGPAMTLPLVITFPPAVPTTLTVGTSHATVCSTSCHDLPPGTSNVHGSSLRFHPFVSGSARTAADEPVPHAWLNYTLDATTTCAACSPTSYHRAGTARTFLSGTYDIAGGWMTWNDMALSECRTVLLHETADLAGVAATADVSYTFCRVS